jgi:uncharacterized protein (TIGR02680 family)
MTRFRLDRAGVLNVWQYDEQIFELSGGRMLLRGANGAGKSKTLEILLPFVLDGDKQRLTASARHHTSLLWLMLEDGAYEGQSRVGYVWVEFTRIDDAGDLETVSCAIGIRASKSARTATSWCFTVPGRIGDLLALSTPAGPLTRETCRESVEDAGGQFFDSPRAYKEHVGKLLFGLDRHRYDELLKLLYWLRSPQIGEDLDPGRVAGILSLALPQLDSHVVRKAGDNFDQLAEFGEQLARSQLAAEAVEAFCRVYRSYAAAVLKDRGQALVDAGSEQHQRVRAVARARRTVARLGEQLAAARAALEAARAAETTAMSRLTQLDASPEARSAEMLNEKRKQSTTAAQVADESDPRSSDQRQIADRARDALTTDTDELRTQLSGLARSVAALGAELGELGVNSSVPHLTFDDDLGDAEPKVRTIIAGDSATVDAIVQALAGVEVVAQALERATADARASQTAAEREVEAEATLELAGRQLADATAAAERAVGALQDALVSWQADPRAVEVTVPDVIVAASLHRLHLDLRAQAEPTTRDLQHRQAHLSSEIDRFGTELDTLRLTRDEIAATRDPAPADPPWRRTDRTERPGDPLWRLTDFAEVVPDDQRAAIEAALESAGLLDAWITPTGSVLDPETLDVLLTGGAEISGPTLADILIPTTARSVLTDETVRALLRCVAIEPAGSVANSVASSPIGTTDDASVLHRRRADDRGPAIIRPDGSWVLGPLSGRAAKSQAQFIGAAARTAERARRLAAVEAEIAIVSEHLQATEDARREVGERLAEVVAWLSDIPPVQEVIVTWTVLDARTDERDRAAATHRARVDAAIRARQLASASQAKLDQLAVTHRTPADAAGLDAHRERLRDVRSRWSQHIAVAGRILKDLERWTRTVEAVVSAESAAVRADQAAQSLRNAAAQAATEYETLRETHGLAVQQLDDARRMASAERQTARSAAGRAQGHLDELHQHVGAAEQAVSSAEHRRDEHAPAVHAAVLRLARTAEVAGIVDASGVELAADQVRELAGAAAGMAVDDSVPEAAQLVATTCARLAPGRVTTTDDVYKAHHELASGPAADTEPRVVVRDDVLAVEARDAAGSCSIVDLSGRLAAAVEANRDLLTTRERRYFEEHLLGELGEVLRATRIDAGDLVDGMNDTLQSVRTSQGIRVRLDWRLRDDVAPEVRIAVELLTKPLGMLLPDERSRLRDALHAMVEASRAEDPALSYVEHLEQALDYRRWSEFRVRIQRPEKADTWTVLNRRTPLSQGEQKVVSYLPLFAAAAAHFHSVAGAAPHAPRFVLLDDAFPKIDARTHPELFGLLVDLDLDFVITSERLWGTCAEVPSLSIYEALRSPGERGIAQYKHLWDGSRLRAIGA